MIFNLSKEDILGMQFDNQADAQGFYCRYAYVKGFAVKLSNINWSSKCEMIWWKYVCNSQR